MSSFVFRRHGGGRADMGIGKRTEERWEMGVARGGEDRREGSRKKGVGNRVASGIGLRFRASLELSGLGF